MNSAVGQYLRMVRTQKALTLAEVASKVGISLQGLSLIETGRRAPGSPRTLKKISFALGIEENIMRHLYAMDKMAQAQAEWDKET